MIALLFVACQYTVTGKNGVTYTTALQYNNYISNKQKVIINLFIRYAESNKVNDFTKLEAILDTAAATTVRYIADIEGMPAWKGDSAFRDNAVMLFRFYNKTFNNDYRSIVNMQKDGTVTVEEQGTYNELATTLTSTEGRLDANLKRAQQAFAQKNGFRTERIAQQDQINEMRGAK